MNIYAPFTYLVGWSELGLYYYGSMSRQHRPVANPDIMWKKYFTSSKYVQKIRKKHGEPDIIQIRRVFDCGIKCRMWERKVLQRLNVLQSDKWLNKNVGGTFLYDDEVRSVMREKKLGAKNYMYGKTHSTEAREKISLARSGIDLSEEHKKSISSGLYDFYQTEESEILKERFRENISGENGIHFSGYFLTPWGKFTTIGLAMKSCPVLIARKCIRRWCKKSETKICNNTYKTSGYLQHLSIDKDILLEMTYADLGFGFEEAESKRGQK